MAPISIVLNTLELVVVSLDDTLLFPVVDCVPVCPITWVVPCRGGGPFKISLFSETLNLTMKGAFEIRNQSVYKSKLFKANNKKSSNETNNIPWNGSGVVFRRCGQSRLW